MEDMEGKMNKKIIFLIGPPASGKGTQAKLLIEKTGFYHFITSKEGKDYIATHQDDPETKKQEVLYKKGELFNPEWLIRVQKERVEEILKNDIKGVLFDGSPRTLYEAENLPKLLSSFVGKENIITVVINVSEEELERRTVERLVCSENENHVVSTRLNSDVKIGDKCLQCGGVLQKRDLDMVVEERIKEYNERTVPGINFLKENYKVAEVNGEQSVGDVHKDIMEALADFLK